MCEVRVSPDCPLFSVFAFSSTWWASSDPVSKTNHHYLRHGAVEGICTFLYLDTQGKRVQLSVVFLFEFMLLLWLWMQLSLFPGPGRVSLAWRNGHRECQTNSSTQSRCGGEMILLMKLYQKQKQTAWMYHNEGKKRERAAVYSSRHMWKGGKYSQAPSACKCLLEPHGKA